MFLGRFGRLEQGKQPSGGGKGRDRFASRGDLDVFFGADGRVEVRPSLFTRHGWKW